MTPGFIFFWLLRDVARRRTRLLEESLLKSKSARYKELHAESVDATLLLLWCCASAPSMMSCQFAALLLPFPHVVAADARVAVFHDAAYFHTRLIRWLFHYYYSATNNMPHCWFCRAITLAAVCRFHSHPRLTAISMLPPKSRFDTPPHWHINNIWREFHYRAPWY